MMLLECLKEIAFHFWLVYVEAVFGDAEVVDGERLLSSDKFFSVVLVIVGAYTVNVDEEQSKCIGVGVWCCVGANPEGVA